jgi:hypothetical protein
VERPNHGRTERRVYSSRIIKGEEQKHVVPGRPTGDKWIGRYQRGESMGDRSRTPFRTPNKTSGETEEAVQWFFIEGTAQISRDSRF